MNTDRLKLLMMGLMVLDHTSYSVPSGRTLIFHVVIRCVGVFFGYMAVEGFSYIWNIYRYDGRSYIWAVIASVGNMLLNRLVNNPAITIHNNIFFTLALGVSMLVVTRVMLEMPKVSLEIALLISILATLEIGAMFAEGGIAMLPSMLITYLARKRLVLRGCLYGALALFLLVTNFQWLGDWPAAIEVLAYNSDFMSITVLPFISLYDDEGGSRAPFFRYLFYGFYPLHLQLIALVVNYVR